MKPLRSVACLAALALLCPAVASFADQLAWIPKDMAEKGAQAIPRNSLLVSYCSLCDDTAVEVWLVRKATVAATQCEGLFKVRVLGQRLLASTKRFQSGTYAEPLRFPEIPPDEQSVWVQKGIDLAYVYVPSGGKSFRCLGKVLGLDCDVAVETITLPDDVMAKVLQKRDAKRPRRE
jgi:hypothetical protein